MPRENVSLVSFNRGIVDRRGLARLDVKRIALAASIQTNMTSRVLGSMSLRPGFGYVASTYTNSAARLLKFIFGTTDTALLELTDSLMRIIINDTLLTRPAVTSAVTNGDFTVNVAGWTDNDEVGGVSQWVAPGYLQLAGDGTARAIRDQQVTVAGANINVEHALRIVIARGPVYLRVGSTSGGDEYVTETALGTGTHSLAFTPAGDFFIRFFSSLIRVVWVNSCNLEAAGVVTLPTPWTAALLSNVRPEQSADVVFLACLGKQQRRIERRGTRPQARSWSIVLYQPEDGPFNIENVTPTMLAATALTGNITISASKALFRSSHVGALVSLTASGQQVSVTSAATGGVTASIRVTGIDNERVFSVIISGDATLSTVTLQRAYDNATWANLANTWTADVTEAIDDTLDNQIVYYRLRLTNRIAPDNITMTLTIGSGSIRGVARITDFTNSQTVGAEVLSAMGGITDTAIWQIGMWSDASGYPSSVRLQEGRLWWFGLNRVWGSISDTIDSFDETFPGDAGPINRTIGAGPVDTIQWALALQRILLGAEGSEESIRSSSIDEPVTPTNFHIKTPSTQGSANVDAVQVDQQGYFVSRNGVRVYELAFDVRNYDYTTNDATELCPEIGSPSIVRMDVQRQPDTRLHCVRSDGVVALMLVEKAQDVRCWVTVETNGVIEDVCTLPAVSGNLDDQVYYVVKRTINGATVRFIEKWAQESECLGDARCRLADAHSAFTAASPTVTFSLPHLPNTEVVVWADGADVGTNDTTDPANWTQRFITNGSGVLTLTTAATNVVAGLGYTGQFQSAKLGQALNRSKSATHLGLVMADVHKHGLRIGRDFDVLDNLPDIEQGTTVSEEVREAYDEEMIVLPGEWNTDERLCLQAQAPRPVTVMAAIVDVETV